MLSQALRLLRPVSNYRTTPKIADHFNNVLQRSGWIFDHVAVDVDYLVTTNTHFTRDLTGHERDRETATIIHRQLTTLLLRRIQPRKSLALFFKGSEPLWRVQHLRLHPGKRFDEKFYRSAASSLTHVLEERLRGVGPELRMPPMECLICGSGVPGPVEGKMSAWMLDLATRILRPATRPPHAAAVTANDSLCLIGGTELFLAALGATPFHNISVVSLMQGELKSLSLLDSLEWMAAGALLTDPVHQGPQQRLAAVRTDLVFLYLLTHAAPVAGLEFADLLDAYAVEQSAFFARCDGGAPRASRCLEGLLFDEFALLAGHLDAPSLRLKPCTLAQLLVRACKRPVTCPSCHCEQAAAHLETLLQSHAMLCSGGIPNMGWTPGGSCGTHVPEKPAQVAVEQLIGHLRFVCGERGEAAGVAYIAPTRDRSFALTGLESLLLTAPRPEVVDQLVPLYVHGHAMPPGVAQGIIDTPNVREALAKARAVLSGLNPDGGAPPGQPTHDHPVVRHYPTHYLVRSPGSQGPPHGWSYFSVNLGIKAETMNARHCLNAATVSRVLNTTESQGLHKRDHLHVFSPATGRWCETPCELLRATPVATVAVERATLRLATWNVQFGRHSGERTPLGRQGIDWCTPTRYMALSQVLAETDADVIAMQEAERPWCVFLAQQQWVREGYAMSCQEHGHAITPWGVLMLIRKDLRLDAFDYANIPAFSGHTSVMPEATLVVASGVPPITVGSVHLLAPYSQNHLNNREAQLENLVQRLKAMATTSHVLMGDFNDYPAKLFSIPPELGYRDAWEVLHPAAAHLTSEERGYTIDGDANAYAKRIIEPQFYGRPDRVMYVSTHLQPIHAELLGTRPVMAVLQPAGVTRQVDRPHEDIPAHLFPSDHFGVLVEFQVL